MSVSREVTLELPEALCERIQMETEQDGTDAIRTFCRRGVYTLLADIDGDRAADTAADVSVDISPDVAKRARLKAEYTDSTFEDVLMNDLRMDFDFTIVED